MEWTVVTVIVALVGLFVTVGKPIISLNNNLVKLNLTLDHLKEDLDTQKKALADQQASAHNSHKRLWEHNEAQDKILNDHETRISHLEHQ